MSAAAEEPADGALARLVCFDLYAASRAVTGVYRQVLDPLGLTYPQYLVLVVLWRHGAATVREVIAELDLDYGTVSPLLKRLESRGLVERRRRADDERSVEITLTAEGRRLEEHVSRIAEVIAGAFGLADRQVSALQGLLARVRTSATRESERLAASPLADA